MDDGHVIVLGPCYACGRLFGFNPNRVPSVPVDPESRMPPDLIDDPAEAMRALARAEREPICQSCIDRANEIRRHDGRPEIEILPGAYDPALESELRW